MMSLIEEMQDNKDRPLHYEEYIRNTAGAAYAAGSDTVCYLVLVVFCILIVTLDRVSNNEFCARHGLEPGCAA